MTLEDNAIIERVEMSFFKWNKPVVFFSFHYTFFLVTKTQTNNTLVVQSKLKKIREFFNYYATGQTQMKKELTTNVHVYIFTIKIFKLKMYSFLLCTSIIQST